MCGSELEVWRISRKVAKQRESRPQTLINAKQDGVLTGSPLPKGIEEESPGGQRSLTLAEQPSGFSTSLTPRERFQLNHPYRGAETLGNWVLIATNTENLYARFCICYITPCSFILQTQRTVSARGRKSSTCYIASILSCIPHKETSIIRITSFSRLLRLTEVLSQWSASYLEQQRLN